MGIEFVRISIQEEHVNTHWEFPNGRGNTVISLLPNGSFTLRHSVLIYGRQYLSADLGPSHWIDRYLASYVEQGLLAVGGSRESRWGGEAVRWWGVMSLLGSRKAIRQYFFNYIYVIIFFYLSIDVWFISLTRCVSQVQSAMMSEG